MHTGPQTRYNRTVGDSIRCHGCRCRFMNFQGFTPMRSLTVLILSLSFFSSGAFAGSVKHLSLAEPNLTARSAILTGIDIGTGVDITGFGATITEATGAGSPLTGTGTIDLSFAFDPNSAASLPGGGLPSPLVSIDPSYLVLSTLIALDSGPGTIELLFANDDPGSTGFADFHDQVLVSIELIGVTGDPFAYIVDAVAAGFGFADFDANIMVDNVAAAPGPGTPSLIVLGLLIISLTRRRLQKETSWLLSALGMPLRSNL